MPTSAHGHDSFSSLSARVVAYLRRTTPISDWSINRVVGGQQVHLHVDGNTLIETGDRRDWEKSFCRRVVELGADSIVPDVTRHPQFRDLVIPGARSYASAPIRDDSGELFGMICGLGTDPLPATEDDLGVDAELLGLLGDLIGSHLTLSRRLENGDRSQRMSEATAQIDALTGLVNRRGWDAVLADAAVRTSAYGDLAAVIVADLDAGRATYERFGDVEGDLLIRRAAEALQSAQEPGETVARFGEDEFVVLVEDVSPRLLGVTLRRYRTAFEDADVAASFGWSLVYPGDEPADAVFHRAHASMQEDRKLRASHAFDDSARPTAAQ